MQLVQTHLTQGNDHMVTWLEPDSRVKVGSLITLDKVEGVWRVAEQYSYTLLEAIFRGWGLDLPKSQRTER